MPDPYHQVHPVHPGLPADAAEAQQYIRNGREPVLSGWLYRESAVVTGVSNGRWGALYQDSLVTFRKQNSTEPSKIWPLHGLCKLSPLSLKEFMVRDKHTSTLWALAAGHYQKHQLVRPALSLTRLLLFTVHCALTGCLNVWSVLLTHNRASV